MFRKIATSIALFGSVIAGGCYQTVEDDYPHFAEVAERCSESRLNRPIISASANGSYSAQSVNTQTIGCAGAARSFEIIQERGQ